MYRESFKISSFGKHKGLKIIFNYRSILLYLKKKNQLYSLINDYDAYRYAKYYFIEQTLTIFDFVFFQHF